MSEVDNIIFYKSFYESLQEFSEKDRLELYDAIFKFAFDNINTEFTGMKKAIFTVFKPLIEANIANQTRGKKGGRPKKTGEINADDVYITEIVEQYHKIIDKNAIISTKNREQIARISEDNNLKLEDWTLIFKNAKRGWDYKDKHVEASFKKILSDWESFHRGDNGLAPNAEQEETEKLAKEQEIQRQLQAREQLDTSLDTEFFVYDDYRHSRNTEKLKAQKIYEQEISENKSHEDAISSMIKFLKGVTDG